MNKRVQEYGRREKRYISNGKNIYCKIISGKVIKREKQYIE